MVGRSLSLPHRFVCATNNGAGIDKEIEVVPVEQDLIGLGNAFPKLAAFRSDAKQYGDRLCVIDLDAVIVGPLDSLFNRTDDFLIWQDVLAKSRPGRFKYNSSLILMDAGARAQVWEDFKPNKVRRIIATENRCGSDQAWISHCLDGEPTWAAEDGVLSWRFDVQGNKLQDNAKVIFFHGRQKPWDIRENDLVKRYWQ